MKPSYTTINTLINQQDGKIRFQNDFTDTNSKQLYLSVLLSKQLTYTYQLYNN